MANNTRVEEHLVQRASLLGWSESVRLE